MMMPRSPYDCIVVAYAYRDGNARELFLAFDMDAAEDAVHEAETDGRFGKVGRDVGFAVLLED